jgi:DNA polymerase I-like protein with 3'-5' exonuclease and polymerase domains
VFDTEVIDVPAGKHYEFAHTPKALDRLFRSLSKPHDGGLCFDVETTFPTGRRSIGEPPKERVCGISFCWRPHEAVYVPLYLNKEGDTYFQSRVFDDTVDAIRSVLEDERIPKHNQNIKFDAKAVYWSLGIRTRGMVGDPMLAHGLLDENRSVCGHGLDDMSVQYLPVGSRKLKTAHARLLEHYDPVLKRHSKVPPHLEAIYGCADADVAYQLHHVFLQMLEAEGLLWLYQNLTLPLCSALAFMESYGCPFNGDRAKQLREFFIAQQEHVRAHAQVVAGRPLDLGSPSVLSRFFFEDPNPATGLPRHDAAALGLVRGKNGDYPTDESTLGRIKDDPLVPLVLDDRRVTKLKGTYVDGLVADVYDSRIYNEFDQLGTVTGRLSCKGVLEVLPRAENGGDLIKSMIEAPPGAVVVSCDQSQIEIRVLADQVYIETGDRTMIDAFEAGHDVHAATAHKVFRLDCEVSEVKSKYPEYRSRAKAVNFGIAYGAGPQTLAEQISCTVEEAEKVLADYFASMPGVKRYIEIIHERVKRDGFVRNPFGRKRRLPNAQLATLDDYSWKSSRAGAPSCFVKSGPSYKYQLGLDIHQTGRVAREELARILHDRLPDLPDEYRRCVPCAYLAHCSYAHEQRRIRRDLSEALRQSVNAVIQGFAVDLTSLALARIVARIRREGWDAAPVNHVHDDLVFEVASAQAEAFAVVVSEEMEGAWKLHVPLKAEPAIFKVLSDKDCKHAQLADGTGGPVILGSLKDGGQVWIRLLHRNGVLDPALADMPAVQVDAAQCRKFTYKYAA